MELNNIQQQGKWSNIADRLNENFSAINSELLKILAMTRANKGFFETPSDLIEAYPAAVIGDVAYVGISDVFHIFKWNGTSWVNTGLTIEENIDINGVNERIEAIQSNLNTVSNELSQAISQETTNREALEARLSQEISNTQANIEQVNNALSQEISELNVKDNELTERLDVEGTGLITVDEMINFNPIANEGGSYLVGYLDKPSRYVVTKEVGGVPVNVGILEILSDSAQHVYTQVFTTHFTLDNSGNLDIGAHSDTKLVTYFRSYSIDSPLIDIGTWTKWKDISHYSDILAMIDEERHLREEGDTPIIMTEEEYNAAVESGEITETDTTIRYIIE